MPHAHNNNNASTVSSTSSDRSIIIDGTPFLACVVVDYIAATATTTTTSSRHPPAGASSLKLVRIRVKQISPVLIFRKTGNVPARMRASPHTWVIRKTYEGRRNASGRRQETNFLFVFDVMTQEQARQSALSDVSNGNRQLRFEK